MRVRESERKVSECSMWIDFQFDPIRFDSGKHHQHAHKKKDLSNGGALVLSYLEVERAVHAVLLRPEDARQVFRHDDDDDDERRIYTEGKIWSIKKVANVWEKKYA